MNDEHPQWLFDESMQVGVDYTNEDLAADYDSQHEGFRNFKDEAGKIITALNLSKESIVLDIGCGTGGLSTHLAPACRHVYSVDVSKAMLSILDSKIKNQNLTNITTIQAGFLTYDHKGEAIDAIVANMTLHHMPDFWKQIALCRLYDILVPGGKLFLSDVVFDFPPRSYRKIINEWLNGMKEMAGSKMAEEAVVHIRDEFSTWDWITSGMLERACFEIESSIERMPQAKAYICSKSRK